MAIASWYAGTPGTVDIIWTDILVQRQINADKTVSSVRLTVETDGADNDFYFDDLSVNYGVAINPEDITYVTRDDHTDVLPASVQHVLLTSTFLHKGLAKTTSDDPMDATPGNRPAGELGEIVRYSGDGALYYCTDETTPVWAEVGGGGGTVTSVTGTTPINSSGGTDPDISIDSASTSQAGAVQLSNSYSGSSEVLAVTELALSNGLASIPVDPDEKVKYDAGDPSAGYVADKIIAGDGISVAEGTGANENKLEITNTDKGSDVDLSGLCPLAHKTTEDAINGLVKVDGAGNYSGVTDNSSNWNSAYGWGDHSGLYTPIAFKTTLDAVNGLIKCDGAGSYSGVTDSSSNWGSAYSHKTTEDAINGMVKCNGAGSYSAVTDSSSNWNTAYTNTLKTIVSANDTTGGYLNGKLVAGTGITLTENDDGGDETLSIAQSEINIGSADFYPGMGFRQILTVDHAKVSGAGTITDYMIRVVITDPDNPIFDNSQADGDDIIFTDTNNTLLPFCRVLFDPVAEELYYFVLADVSAIVDTEIYIYYGDSSASYLGDTASTTTGYETIYPLNNDLLDYGAREKDGTNSSSTNDTSGKILDGRAFVGASTQYFHNGQDGWRITQFGEGSVGLWFKHTGTSRMDLLGVVNDGTNEMFEISMNVDKDYGASTNKLAFVVRDTNAKDIQIGITDAIATLNDGNWHHLVVKWKYNAVANSYAIYVDGVSKGVTAGIDEKATYTTGLTLWDYNFCFGVSNIRGSYTNPYTGSLDEIWFHPGNLSADYIITLYNNEFSPATFYSLGSEESGETATVQAVYDDFTSKLWTSFQSGWVEVDNTAEEWTYTGADDPTYTLTLSGDKTTKYYPGQKVKLTQSTGGTKFFIITGVSFSAPDTTLTLYGGYGTGDSGYDLVNEAITSPYYSFQKAPQGFPLDPTIWEYKVVDTSQRTGSDAVGDVWTNLASTPSIVVPIGAWKLSYQATPYAVRTASGTTAIAYCCLSTANNSASDGELISRVTVVPTGTSTAGLGASSSFYRDKNIILTVKDEYFLNVKCTYPADLYLQNNTSNLVLRAECSYL